MAKPHPHVICLVLGRNEAAVGEDRLHTRGFAAIGQETLGDDRLLVEVDDESDSPVHLGVPPVDSSQAATTQESVVIPAPSLSRQNSVAAQCRSDPTRLGGLVAEAKH